MKDPWSVYNKAVSRCKDVPVQAIVGEVKDAKYKKSKHGNLSITLWVYSYSGGSVYRLLCTGENALLYRWLFVLGNELRIIVRDTPSYSGQIMQQVVYVEPIRSGNPMPYLVFVSLPKNVLVKDIDKMIQKNHGPVLCKIVSGHKERDGEVNLRGLKASLEVYSDYDVIELI